MPALSRQEIHQSYFFQMTQPLLSVVVVNWNAKDFIVGCIQSIFASDYKNLEIILVDNHSEDGSIEFLRKSLAFEVLSKIKIIVNDKNFGAAYALDQGAELAKGKYLTFIATDTKVERECFSQLANLFESDRTIGGASSKLLMMDDHKRIDSAGEYLNQFGLLMQRHAGFEIDRGQFSEVADIFGVKGTALTVRRDVFSEVGGYPKDYFMFLEETDLCWRIWLSGKRIVFLPNAVIYHASGVSINSHKHSSYLVKYYGSRNYIFTLAKNLG
ncbi:MAG: glycosyltransferase family 2 protein, partial [Candidatus Omnitrophica bacterium]|nr:glycosyltransferase family 2 protein [Candidatus Omnitrophota bacterium]